MFLDSSNLWYSDSWLFIFKSFLDSNVFTESMNPMSALFDVAWAQVQCISCVYAN